MFIRAKTLHCSIKNVRNWFGYQRKLDSKREKTETPKIKTENVSPNKNTEKNEPFIDIPILKKEETTNPMTFKKEETTYSQSNPITPINFQGFFSPFSQLYQQTVYQNKACMNNVQFFNQKYAMMAAIMSNNGVPDAPFGFNFL